MLKLPCYFPSFGRQDAQTFFPWHLPGTSTLTTFLRRSIPPGGTSTPRRLVHQVSLASLLFSIYCGVAWETGTPGTGGTLDGRGLDAGVTLTPW